jgi:hypothetical protein
MIAKRTSECLGMDDKILSPDLVGVKEHARGSAPGLDQRSAPTKIERHCGTAHGLRTAGLCMW